MCSQYELVVPLSKIIADTKIITDGSYTDLKWDKHIYPFSQAPVITKFKEHGSLRIMSYSLIPSWSKTAKPKFSTYNARLDRPAKELNKLERIYEAPTWKYPFKNQRCIVPLSGFFESCREGSHAGNIVKLSKSNSTELLLAAGIYNKWTDLNTGEIIGSFAILTDEPIPFIKEVGHDRQPVFLDIDNAYKWLDYEALPPVEAYEFLKDNQQEVDYKVDDVRKLKGFN